MAICRVQGKGKRAASTSTSNTEEGTAVASPSNVASAGADKRTSLKGPAEKGVFAVKQMQWVPSVAHRTSATAVCREKVTPSPSVGFV